MPLLYKPNPLPSELNYVPENSEPYKVNNRDSFYSLAELPQVKKAGLTPNDLCYFNFKTRKPTAINWYLKNKVGCTMSTRDGKNYMFSNADNPGIIYLPKVAATLPVDQFPKTAPAEILPLWIGVGIKAGTTFVAVGIESLTGYVFNVGDIKKGMAITGSTSRLGLGIGASGGVCIIIMTGVTNAQQVNGLIQGGVDYNISVGENWSGLAKLSKLKGAKPVIEVLQKLHAFSPTKLKALLKSPDAAANIAKASQSVKDIYGAEVFAEPNIIVADLPLSGGAEIGVFHGVTEFYAIVDNVD